MLMLVKSQEVVAPLRIMGLTKGRAVVAVVVVTRVCRAHAIYALLIILSREEVLIHGDCLPI